MSSPYHPYLLLSMLLGMAIIFPLMPLLLARLWARYFSPAKPGDSKNAVYECGLVSQGEPEAGYHPQYYLYGIIFLIFDVEAVFLFPFAAAFLDLSLEMFLGMMVFVLLLVEGLVWAWMKGVLAWK